MTPEEKKIQKEINAIKKRLRKNGYTVMTDNLNVLKAIEKRYLLDVE